MSEKVKEYARIADPETLELFQIGELTENEVDLQTDIPQKLESLHQDLHYFITRFLDGEAKLLSINADIATFAEEHKSDAELWRFLVFNYDKKSAYTVVKVVEMIKNVEKAKSMTDIQPKIATLERLYIEFAKGFNESDDADIKGAIAGLKHMTTVGYFDVFKKSDLLRILPDNVIKDLGRSPDVKLAAGERQQQCDSTGGVGCTWRSRQRRKLQWRRWCQNWLCRENVDDDNRFTVYGTDGCLYYLSMKGKGKSAGKGDSVKGATFNGHCSLCGRYEHRVRECRDYPAHLQKGGAPIQGEGKGKSDSGKGDFGKNNVNSGFPIGKSGGKGWIPNSGKGGYANHVGSEYAPELVPIQQQYQSALPKLMAAPWDQQHIGSLCNVVIKNKFEALSVDDEESERKDKGNLERVVVEINFVSRGSRNTLEKGDVTKKKTRNKKTTRQFPRKYNSERHSDRIWFNERFRMFGHKEQHL